MTNFYKLLVYEFDDIAHAIMVSDKLEVLEAIQKKIQDICNVKYPENDEESTFKMYVKVRHDLARLYDKYSVTYTADPDDNTLVDDYCIPYDTAIKTIPYVKEV